jgi:hypothetical protein
MKNRVKLTAALAAILVLFVFSACGKVQDVNIVSSSKAATVSDIKVIHTPTTGGGKLTITFTAPSDMTDYGVVVKRLDSNPLFELSVTTYSIDKSQYVVDATYSSSQYVTSVNESTLYKGQVYRVGVTAECYGSPYPSIKYADDSYNFTAN